MNYDWNYSRLLPYWEAFLAGTTTTVTLTSTVIVLGTIIGVTLGILLRQRNLRLVLYPLIDIIRAVPPLVLILFMYYLLTEQVIGATVGGYWVCAFALGLNLAAFTADLVRAAIENVPRTSIEAGLALGMSRHQLMRHVIFPHVFREVLPGMTILYIGMLKLSSLASVINVREVVYAAQTVIADISRSLEAWSVVAIIYVVLVVPATYLARRVEVWAGRGKQARDRA